MKNAEYVTARNVETRKVGRYLKRVVDKCKFLEVVPHGTKSFVPLAELVAEEVLKHPTQYVPETDPEEEELDEPEEDDA